MEELRYINAITSLLVQRVKIQTQACLLPKSMLLPLPQSQQKDDKKKNRDEP